MKPRVAVILGPTATGKSHCGIALAKRLNGEIISGDSMLVYQRMDIGTAKPSAEELAAVPHHLIDILPPDAVFSVVDFKEKAEKIIADINSRGKLPVIVGGTGLYIKALLENYEFNTVEECSELRSELEAFAEEHGNSALYEKLQALDLEAAQYRDYIEEPYVRVQIITPNDYVGTLMELSQSKRGIFVNMHYIDKVRASLEYQIPLSEVITDFYDQLKSRSKGYASMDYEFSDYKRSKLVKLDILLANEIVDALSVICHEADVYSHSSQ